MEDKVEIELQPHVAHRIMMRHPEVEQVGFVRTLDVTGLDDAVAELRMAGGEFCGNASMSAATWYVETCCTGEEALGSTVLLQASGAAKPVRVEVGPSVDGLHATSIAMPKARAIERVSVDMAGSDFELPVVRFEGISHVIIEEAFPVYELCTNATLAEKCARAWCTALGEDGLGLMFLSGAGTKRELKPLVYVPTGDTMFWENSCASGSAAVGMYLAHDAGSSVEVALEEPGGVLRVCADEWGSATLYGSARCVASHNLL